MQREWLDFILVFCVNSFLFSSFEVRGLNFGNFKRCLDLVQDLERLDVQNIFLFLLDLVFIELELELRLQQLDFTHLLIRWFLVLTPARALARLFLHLLLNLFAPQKFVLL